jgi:hypothetical protein
MLEDVNGAAPVADAASDVAPAAEAPAQPAETDIRATMARVLAKYPDRDEDGTFKSRFPETDKPAAEAPAAEITDQPETPPAETAPAAPSIEPPASWSAEAKAKWTTLPPDVQRVIADRESEAHKAITGMGEKAKFAEQLEEVLGPRRQALAASFGSEAAALKQLFALSDFASNDPAGFAQWFAQQHGLNFGQTNAPAQPQGPQDPATDRRLRAIEQTVSQQQQAAMDADIRSFADAKAPDGAPLRPHFEAVRAQMGRIIGAGLATTLEDAYEQAVLINKDVRAKIEADKAAAAAKAAAEAEAKRREEAAKAAAEARKAASVNVRSTGSPSGSPAKPANMRDTMRAVAEKYYGAGAV